MILQAFVLQNTVPNSVAWNVGEIELIGNWRLARTFVNDDLFYYVVLLATCIFEVAHNDLIWLGRVGDVYNRVLENK